MLVKNCNLFEKARSLKFEMAPSLLELILEKKNIQVHDDIDSIALDLFLENSIRLAKLKWKRAGSHIKQMDVKFGTWSDKEVNITVVRSPHFQQKCLCPHISMLPIEF